jgi:uncharacterized protein YgbK (DUF1537 family)
MAALPKVSEPENTAETTDFTDEHGLSIKRYTTPGGRGRGFGSVEYELSSLRIMTSSPALQLAYFADDFTGSTDALEFLTRAGLKTALFLEPPSPEQLARHSGLQAIGVAGLTRSLAPEPMEAVLRPAFTALRALGPRHVHYKVCSTFDSSPTIGSIGRAIDIGASIFKNEFVPLLVGAPALGRYCVFGQLFARYGIGSAGAIHRLDRHPAISRHPVTPMNEADLLAHLSQQTDKRTALLNLLQLDLPAVETHAALDSLLRTGAEVVLFDLLHAHQLARVGSLIDAFASHEHPLFSVGSSGIEMALGAFWNGSANPLDEPPTSGTAQQGRFALPKFKSPGPAQPLLIISGSCSPVTAGQITWALAHGFTGIALAPDGSNLAEATNATITSLRSGRHTLVYTSQGEATSPAPAAILGTTLGQLARTALAQTNAKRLIVAGGDTSSYAARALGLESLEMIAPLAPGAPLCRAYAPGSPADGIEINFKGGQVGSENYFTTAAEGKS